MKPVIVIDIDDTLNNFAVTYLECAIKYDKTLRGSGIIYKDKWVSDAFDWNKEEKLEFRKQYRSYVAANTTVKDNAIDVIKSLKDKFEIWFLTGRNEKDFDLMYDGTYEWLIKNNVPFDKLIVDNNKAEYLKDKNKVIAFIDDGFNNCESVASVLPNLKIFLFTTKKNKNKVSTYRNIERVNNWLDLKDKIQNIVI